jgi:hypothetical protein
MEASDGATRWSRCPIFSLPTRSSEPQVVGEALADDAHTATPPPGAVESRATSPPVADSRLETPPRAADAGGATSIGDVGGTTSPTVIDVDPISTRPAGAEDLVRDQPQIDQAPGGPGTSGTQVLQPSSSSPRLPRHSINWDTPLSRRIGLRITKTCRPCGPVSSPSTLR